MLERVESWKPDIRKFKKLFFEFCIKMWAVPSVTRWLDYLLNIWPIKTLKNCQ